MFTDKQIAALRYFIFNAKDGTKLSKRILAFLIKQSQAFTRDVCVTLVEDREGYTADEIHAAGMGVDAMQSCNCTTHLNEILDVLGSELSFSFHYGDFDPSRKGDPFNTDGQFTSARENQVANPGHRRRGMPMRYTFWLARKDYSLEATLVVATREKLEQINLSKPGLYLSLEPT